MEALLPLITQVIAGAVGGNLASGALKQVAISTVARTIAGAIGGIGGGILSTIVGAVVAKAR